MQNNKDTAVDFLQMVLEGKIDEAYEKYVDMGGKHHNFFTPAGMEALRTGMKQADGQFPNKKFDVQHVIGEDDLVAVHSHLVLEAGKTDFAAVHIMKFKDGRIVEFWDLAQSTLDAVNTDGAF